MDEKITQTSNELQQQLADQIEFLKQSASSFDNGFEAEAKRMAVSIRVLFHDTKNSRSLMKILDLSDIKLIDTAIAKVDGTVFPHVGLVAINTLPNGKSVYIALLDELPEKPRKVDFDDWWNLPVFIDKEKNHLSRRDLVLGIANQDGGAHVDPSLNAIYAKLSRQNSLGILYSSRSEGFIDKPIGPPERAAIRQITHEVLKSLVPNYTKKIKRTGTIIAGFHATVHKKPIQPTGRNDPCPCGSGLKFKKCCGR